jgi:septum formation protein
MQLVLASKSASRKKVLEMLGFDFSVEPANVEERSISKESVEELTETIACLKAEKIAKLHPDDTVIGVDTMLFKDGKFIGQPDSEENAREIMKGLFGEWHIACTGYCVKSRGKRVCSSLKSRLKLKNVSEKTLGDYISSGLWKGKAGGYNILDKEFENFVEKVEGSRLNIVGLPAEKLLPEIQSMAGQTARKTIEEVEQELFKGKL